MDSLILNRAFGLIKVAPALSAIYLASFQITFPDIIGYLSFDDYIRILINRIGPLFILMFVLIFFIYSASEKLPDKRLYLNQKSVRTLSIYVAIIFIFMFGTRYFEDQIDPDVSKYFINAGSHNIIIQVQNFSMISMSLLWLRSRVRASDNVLGLPFADFFNDRFDAGVLIVFFIPVALDPIALQHSFDVRASSLVNSCQHKEPTDMMRLFNLSSGVLFMHRKNVVFITYDCLEMVEFNQDRSKRY